MKFNMKMLLKIICCIFAIYGILILVRKIANREDKNKEKKWSYYVEPFKTICPPGQYFKKTKNMCVPKLKKGDKCNLRDELCETGKCQFDGDELNYATGIGICR